MATEREEMRRMNLHLKAEGAALAMISVKRLSKAFKSSQATCSIEDILKELTNKCQIQ